MLKSVTRGESMESNFFNKQSVVDARNNNSSTNDTINEQSIFSDMSELPEQMISWIEGNSNELITVWDKTGKALFISKSVKRILGYTLSDFHGSSWDDKISSEDAKYIKTYFANKNNTNHVFNINIRNKYGKYIWTECAISKIVDQEKNDYFYVTMVKDNSNKKEAEEMMIRSEKMSVAGQLAAGIAHEIRNPLTSLKGFMQLLQAGVNRKEEYYKIMIDEIEKMESITSELLFISKPLTNNKKEETAEIMVHEIVALLLPQARLKNVNIIWEEKDKHSVLCDRSQIKQVLINIVKNAIEALETNGTIEITITEKDAELEIAIIDDGPGIPEEIMHKLGEPFFTTKKSGTGLGLMITKQILEKHYGRLEIEQNTNVGSTFKIILPLPEVE